MRADLSSRSSFSAPSRRSLWADLTQNRIIALVLAMIVAVPLLAAPADRSMTGIAAITLESFAVLLMTTLLWRAKWDLRAENVQRFLKTGANLPIVLLFGLISLSCVFSPAKVFSIQEMLRTGSGILLYFVVAYHFRQSKHLSLLVNVVLALSAIVAIGGMAQYQLFAEDRASAVFGNAQPLASFVMLLLPVVASLAWTDKSSNRRIVAMIVSILMVACLMLTQGRSAWAGALAGLLMLAYLATRPVGEQSKAAVPFRLRKHQMVWPVVAVVIAVGFLAITKSQNDTIDHRAIASANLSTDGSWQSRLHTWKGAVEMIAAKPLTGWGTGLYPVFQHKFTGQGVDIKLDGFGTRASLAEQAHNFYLQTAVELGLPGLLLTLATFVCFIGAGLQRLKQMEPGIRRTLLIGSLAATTAFLVDAVASPSWQYGHTAMFLWLMLGVGTSCLRPRVKREESVEVHVPSRRFALVSRPMALAALLVCATLLPTAYGSAQSFDYNDGGSDTGKTVAIVGGIGLGLYLISELVSSAAGGAAAGGVAASGAASTGASATGVGANSGGFSGTSMANAGGSAANVGAGETRVVGEDGTTVVPTATPAALIGG